LQHEANTASQQYFQIAQPHSMTIFFVTPYKQNRGKKSEEHEDTQLCQHAHRTIRNYTQFKLKSTITVPP
jgi:hypothetical protein